MTFRESEPYYGERTDLSSLFDLEPPNVDGDGREGGHESSSEEGEEARRSKVVIGSIPCPVNEPTSEQAWRRVNEEKNLQVYTRRNQRKVLAEQQQPVEHVELQHLEQQVQSVEQEGPEIGDIVNSTPSTTDTPCNTPTPSGKDSSLELPIALRKLTRIKAGKPPSRYGFEHDISNYVSYESLSPAYRVFVSSLQSVEIPKDWKTAKQDPKWHDAMIEELNALEKNRTWEFVHLREGRRLLVVNGYTQ